MRLRLLADVPEGTRGRVVLVSTSRARDLVSIGWAEPAPVKDKPKRRKGGSGGAADHS